jgi:hypothetical protein
LFFFFFPVQFYFFYFKCLIKKIKLKKFKNPKIQKKQKKKIKKFFNIMGNNQFILPKEKKIKTEQDLQKIKQVETLINKEINNSLLKRIDYSELLIEEDGLIGTGSFGQVWKAYFKNNNKKVAIKFLKNDEKNNSENLIKEIINEIKYQVLLKNKINCVEIYGWIYVVNEKDEIFFGIVMEFVKGKDLNYFLKNVRFNIFKKIKIKLNNLKKN